MTSLCILSAALLAATPIDLTVLPDEVINSVDERIYGHFLEHIYHSVNGGLWGEMIWSRSFEDGQVGLWSSDGETLTQTSLASNRRLVFGDERWTDYELRCEARKTGGQEGFLLLARATSDEDFYWANLGGWGNARSQFERGVKGRRWGAFGPSVDGGFETGRWYRLRLRCEGPRLQAFVDDRLLLDVTDPEPHLRGRVGLGTWATAAEFRHLTVIGLDGRTLWDGLPETELASAGVADGWTGFGEGGFAVSNVSPLNGDLCQRIEPRDGEAGLAQGKLAITAGERYRGSLWARGVGAQLTVRLAAGPRVLATAELKKPFADWRELRFELRPTASCADATLQIAVAGAPVELDQVSLMADSVARDGGYRPDLLAAIEGLRPPLVRWPGGCFAEYYNWRDGLGPQDCRVKYPISIWDDQDTNSYGTDEFLRMCERLGSAPLLVIKTGMHQPRGERNYWIRYAQDWVEYCNGPATSPWGSVRAANGHPEPYGVKYWEIDNETWRMGPEAYAEVVREFAPALKAIDPTIVIAACGSGGFNLDWNRRVLAGCAKDFELLSIHHYENPDKFADGPGRFKQFWHDTAALIATSANPAIKLYVSEWNAQSTDWRTGLYCAGLLNAMERSPEVAVAGPALFLRHTSATAWDNAFINFDQTGWFAAPNYVVMKLFREQYLPRRVRLAEDLPAGLDAVATRSDDGQVVVVKLINLDAATKVVDLTVPKAAVAAAWVVAPGSLAARHTLADQDAVRAVTAPAALTGEVLRLDLPAWAVAVVRFRRER